MIWALNSDPFRKPFSILCQCNFVTFFRTNCRYNCSWILEQQAALPEALVDTRVGGIGRQACTIIPKWNQKVFLESILFATSIYWCILVASSLTFDTLGTPSGSLLAPLAPFWLTFDTFWLPFGSLWLTFGTLLEEIMETFINPIYFHEFPRSLNNFYEFSCFSRHHC